MILFLLILGFVGTVALTAASLVPLFIWLDEATSWSWLIRDWVKSFFALVVTAGLSAFAGFQLVNFIHYAAVVGIQ